MEAGPTLPQPKRILTLACACGHWLRNACYPLCVCLPKGGNSLPLRGKGHITAQCTTLGTPEKIRAEGTGRDDMAQQPKDRASLVCMDAQLDAACRQEVGGYPDSCLLGWVGMSLSGQASKGL